MNQISVSGQFSQRQLHDMSRHFQNRTIGLTTLYYAGVCAPVVTAGIHVYITHILQPAGFSGLTIALIASVFAALSGLVWFFIFTRWIGQADTGRSGDKVDTEIILGDTGIILKKQHVETHINWLGLNGVSRLKDATVLKFTTHAPLCISDAWFNEDLKARAAFIEHCRAHLHPGDRL